MLALAAVWIALGTLLLAAEMVVFRSTFSDIGIVLVLWFGAPGALCLAGLVLWSLRKEVGVDPNVLNQRTQARVAIALSLLAAAIVYLLIIFSHKLDPVEIAAFPPYNRLAMVR